MLPRRKRKCYTTNQKLFLKIFFGGASTSAYQVEGASLEDGKGPSCQAVKVINMRDCGTVKGANVLKRAIEIIEEHK